MNNFENILVPTKDGFISLKLSTFLFLKAEGSYTNIKTNDKEILVSRNLKQFEEVLPIDHFIRVHKSYIVNINSIKSITKSKHLAIILHGNLIIPVSESKRDYFFEKLKETAIVI